MQSDLPPQPPQDGLDSELDSPDWLARRTTPVRLHGRGPFYRILSFDGGPNTLTYLRCLRALELRQPGLVDRTDLFAGTSDGAFAAAYFASRTRIGVAEIDACIAMIERILREAIAPNRLQGPQERVAALADRVSPRAGAGVRSLDKPLRAASSWFGAARMASGLTTWTAQHQIEAILRETIDPAGTLTLGDLPRDVVIVSYAVGARSRAGLDGVERVVQRPKVFQNIDRHDVDCEQSLVATTLRSAALPLFMPIHERHVDGAVFANNPAMCAIAAAVANRAQGEDDRFRLLANILLLSMGADDGRFGSQAVTDELQGKAHASWGWMKWLAYGGLRNFEDMALLFDIFMNSDAAGVNYQAGQLLGHHFLRIAPPGKTRTVDKFVNVLLGRVVEIEESARQTAAQWASEALDFSSEEDSLPVESEILARRKQMHEAAEALRRQRDRGAGWAERRMRGRVVFRRKPGSEPRGTDVDETGMAETYVPLLGTLSIVHAEAWARRYWMQGQVGAHARPAAVG